MVWRVCNLHSPCVRGLSPSGRHLQVPAGQPRFEVGKFGQAVLAGVEEVDDECLNLYPLTQEYFGEEFLHLLVPTTQLRF